MDAREALRLVNLEESLDNPLALSDLRWVSARLGAELRSAVGRLVEHNAALVKGAGDQLWSCDALWGPAWAGHGFGQAPFFLASALTEPHATKELVSWLCHGHKSARAQAFTAALFTAARVEPPAELRHGRLVSISAEVFPEKLGSGKARSRKRLDIVATFMVAERLHHVVVEAKFDHRVTGGQLPAYARWASAGGATAHLFLLGLNKPKALRRNLNWRFASWSRFMAALEANLAAIKDEDEGFQRFRAQLFARIRT